MPLLEVTDYSVEFATDRGPARVVDGVSFTIDRGRTLGIVGESGSGKSVLNRSLMGLVSGAKHSESGSAKFDGREIVGTDRQGLWGSGIAMIFQDPMTTLNPVMRIDRQLAEPLRKHLGLRGSAIERRSLELLDQVGLAEPDRRLKQFPHQLSGGLRQRILIAMALAGEPSLLIADEPTTALDVTVQKNVLDMLADVQRERDMALILITHDLGVAHGRTDDVMVMYGGRVVEITTAERLFANMMHPYTEALLAATPRVDQPKHSRLTPIEGVPPDPVALPPGCRFAPRCRYAQPDCLRSRPELQRWSPHQYACFYPVGTQRASEALARNRAAGETGAGSPLRDDR